ncbi:DUF6090 family protein [Lacinutrix iliipiscaria]|uniref:DUF6090 family protein n=1 Tax=Lacinutrix iliipiscaria TaxID=1230532 RepID=A0ABW5WQH2_9FLAO
MIKFFRKIRQNLLSEGKTGKYLKYAIGEIILVVIGILIALQINNANEIRKERDKEINSLLNLKADLVSEIENTERFATYRFEKAMASSTLLNFDEPNSINDVQEYTDTYEKVFIWNTYVPNNNTFKELLSSGNLSRIKNDSIKNKLLELEKHYADISGGEHHMRREYETYLYDPHVKNIKAIPFFDLSKPNYGFPNRLRIEDIPTEQHQRLIENAKWQHNNDLFKNGLRLAYMNNSFLAGMHKNLAEYIQDLIKLIDDEIKK